MKNQAFFTSLLLFASSYLASADWVPLWPGEAPGGAKPLTIKESIGNGGRITDIEQPQYEVYQPESSKRTGAAVVIFPGGGYTILAMDHEGRDYAKWFNQVGITAIIVKYRVSGKDEARYQFPVPLLDARRAIRVTRSKATEWGVDPAKVGVIGSSAELLNKVSTDKQVNAQTPSIFLVHAANDVTVPVRNSLEFAARCAENKVPVVCHVFSQGSHGFGMRGKGDSANWQDLLAVWLTAQNLASAR